ncbi:MAG: SCO family protein [Rhodobacteraceae bacterium]|nr:SCO family protein [Paracoccaceae bacterium]
MSGKIAAIAAGVVFVGVGGAFLAVTTFAPSNNLQACIGSAVAGGDIGGPFTLVSETGETVTDVDVITEPTLVYFGYTFCPDVCPLDMARMAEAMEILEEEKGHEVPGLFITIDPERDTPEYLAEFTEYLHPNLTGLTGSEEQVAAAAGEYRAFYRKVDSDDPDYYLMDHSTLTYLMNPGGEMITFFRRDLQPEVLAEQIGCIVEALDA